MAKQSGLEITLTAAQLTTLAAEAASANAAASGTFYRGLSLPQFLAAVNAPETTLNPAPQGTILPQTVPLAEVIDLLSTGIESAAFVTLTSSQQNIAAKLFDQVGNAMSSGSTTIAGSTAANWLSKFVAYGLLTGAQVTAIITLADPAYQSRVPAGPPAQRLFGLPLILIEAGDCAGLTFPLS